MGTPEDTEQHKVAPHFTRPPVDSNNMTVEDLPCPGNYVITHDNIKLSPFAALGSALGVERLSAGTVINVLEVQILEEEKRVRGRIESPEGWISLMNTENGYRWAAPV